MDIEIDIDSLRLQGIDRLSRDELVELVQHELSLIIERYGVPEALRRGGAVEIGRRAIRITAGASHQQIGREIAQGIAGDWYGAPLGKRGER